MSLYWKNIVSKRRKMPCYLQSLYIFLHKLQYDTKFWQHSLRVSQITLDNYNQQLQIYKKTRKFRLFATVTSKLINLSSMAEYSFFEKNTYFFRSSSSMRFGVKNGCALLGLTVVGQFSEVLCNRIGFLNLDIRVDFITIQLGSI